ncbi:MAG: ABC transporter ATP-binding protein [Calditrichaceae bacterium]|nr:ABC transporter ATP-binding protein [Calditrichaceae bacterium]
MKIEIKGLTKIYKNGKTALKDVNLTITNGMFGLLGPNGAGKTTLMRILVTLLNPTYGKVMIDGYDLLKNRKQIRSMLGYLPQDFNTFPKVRVWEFLDYNARLAGLKNHSTRMTKIDELLEKVGLFDVRDRMANKLSGGMKRRLGIAQALIGDPKLLIVDEPTTGLDPEERIRFRGILTEMSREDRIIILSTHIVGDISSSCNDMAVIVNGEVGFNDAPEKLIEKARGHTFSMVADDYELERIKEQYAVISTVPVEEGWRVEVVSNSMIGTEIEPNLEHAYVHFITDYAGEYADVL